MRKEATAEFHQISMPAFQSPSVRRSRFARIPGEVVGCASEDAQSTEPNRPSSLRVRILTAILRTFTTLRTAFTPLLAQETTAHDRQARHQTSAVLLLLGRRALLLVHGLLVLHLLGRRALLVALLGVAGGRQSHIKMWGEEGRLITLGAGRTTAAGTAAAGCCSSLGQTLWKCCCEFFLLRGCCVLGFKMEACENA